LELYKNILKENIDKLFDMSCLTIKDEENSIIFEGKCAIHKSEDFICYLKKMFSSDIKNIFKIALNNSIPSISIGDINDLVILNSDIRREYNANSIKLIINKNKIRELYSNKYQSIANVNLIIFYNINDCENKIINSHTYLEDVLSEKCYTIFLVINSNLKFWNDGFAIISEENLIDSNLHENINRYSTYSIKRKEEIQNRNRISNWISRTKWITPRELFIGEEKFNDKIEIYLIKECIDLIIKSLANITIESDNNEKSVFIGSKTIEIEFQSNEYNIKALQDLYNMYLWVFNDLSNDKITFVRNIVVSMVVAKCQGNIYDLIIKNSDWILTASKEAYKNFIGQSVEDYFESRLKLVDKIKDNIGNINKNVDELINKNNTNLLSFIAVIATGLLTYTVNKASCILLIRVILIGYSLFLLTNIILAIPNIKRRNIQIVEEYNQNIEKYDKNFKVQEPLELEKKHFEENNKYIEKNLKLIKYLYCLIILIITFIVFKPGFLEWVFSLIK
jgi:hypothetical protein